MEEEEESSRPCVEYEVPSELLLHSDKLMSPLEIGFEKFNENFWIVQQFRSWKNRKRRKNAGTVQLA